MVHCRRYPASFNATREACGVFGVFSPGEDVARMAYFGLIQLQHRGEESAGSAVANELMAQKTALEQMQ